MQSGGPIEPNASCVMRVRLQNRHVAHQCGLEVEITSCLPPVLKDQLVSLSTKNQLDEHLVIVLRRCHCESVRELETNAKFPS